MENTYAGVVVVQEILIVQGLAEICLEFVMEFQMSFFFYYSGGDIAFKLGVVSTVTQLGLDGVLG